MNAVLISWLLFLQSAIGFEAPYLSGPVVDEARLLTHEEAAVLDNRVRQICEKTSVQLAILIASSLQGLEVEQYSLQVAEAWKLGKKGEDRGLLFVVAPNERRMRLETGYGVEGEIPDAIAKRILSDGVAPFFKQKQYARGLLTGLEWIEARLENKPFEGPQASSSRQQKFPSLFIFLIVLVFIGLSIFRSIFSPRRYWGKYDRSGWGGGGWGGGSWGGGGGGWSGGGGGFGGGGSSSSW